MRAKPRVLTDDEVRDIRASAELSEYIAKRLQVTSATINSVRSAKSYKHVIGMSALPPKPEKSIQILLEIDDYFIALDEHGDVYSSYDKRRKLHPITWRMIFDQETHAFYTEPICNEKEYEDIGGFLNRAWAYKEDYFFQNKPDILKVPATIQGRFKNIIEILSSHNVACDKPSSDIAQYVGIGQRWTKMAYLLGEDLLEDEITLNSDSLMDWAKIMQMSVFTICWHQREVKNVYQELGFRMSAYRTSQSLGFIHSHLYFNRTARKDYLETMKKYWPAITEKGDHFVK